MKKRSASQFLTVSLFINFFLVVFLIWEWGTGGRIIFVQPHFKTLAKIVPYSLALACVYLGFTSWLYFLIAYALERWPSFNKVARWITSTELSARFLVVYAAVAAVLLGLGIPYVSARAHIVRSLIAELGAAGQGIALFGSVASIFGLLRLLTEDRQTSGAS